MCVFCLSCLLCQYFLLCQYVANIVAMCLDPTPTVLISLGRGRWVGPAPQTLGKYWSCRRPGINICKIWGMVCGPDRNIESILGNSIGGKIGEILGNTQKPKRFFAYFPNMSIPAFQHIFPDSVCSSPASSSALNNILGKYLARPWPLKKYWKNTQNQHWKYWSNTHTSPGFDT